MIFDEKKILNFFRRKIFEVEMKNFRKFASELAYEMKKLLLVLPSGDSESHVTVHTHWTMPQDMLFVICTDSAVKPFCSVCVMTSSHSENDPPPYSSVLRDT